MKEDIKYLQRFIDKCKLRGYEFYGILHPPHFEMLQNLINKYKEQEKHIKALDSVVIEHIEKNKEQEKIIELMVDSLSYNAFYMDEASEYCEVKKKECDCYQNKSSCKECLLDYFKKKAREE